MVKSQIVNTISQRTGIRRSAVIIIVDQMMTCIKDALSEGDNVTLRGFGSFVLKKRYTRHFHAPSGELFIIPEHLEPFFKPCKEFKNKLSSIDIEASQLGQ